MTRSGQPAIGQVAEIDGLYAAVGHYADGVILGPSTGEFARELIVADGVGRGAFARYRAAGFLANPAEAQHSTRTLSHGKRDRPARDVHPGNASGLAAQQNPARTGPGCRGHRT